GPLEQVKPWNTNGIEGISRFLNKAWRLVWEEFAETPRVTETKPDEAILKRMHKAIKKVSEDTEQLKFNTAISEMMVLTNELHKAGCYSREAVETVLVMLSPFAPHLTEELWQTLGHAESISGAAWPTFDAALAADDVLTIAVQVNGKLRGTFQAPAGCAKEAMIEEAKKVESVAKFLEGQTIVKEIAVPGKLVNFAVKPN
ncbi:MAG: class I tRNA ligase family protein, partial [Chlorobaculum sp.]|nr:class I tRNA ligase family protein [Chlorobaculum sp.]